MKIFAKVPTNTIPYKCGYTLMACTVTEEFEFISAAEFFKTNEDAKLWQKENPEYKFKREE